MKRIYSKPDIMFEDFTLSTSIAASCDIRTFTPTAGTCGYPVVVNGLRAVLFNDTSYCEWTPDAFGLNDKVCYDVPTDMNRLFNS